jgi:hypothetical protein
MRAELTANEMSGRATGVLFFAGFGMLWLLLGLYAKERMTVVNVATVLVGFAALGSAAAGLLGKAKSLPRAPENKKIGRVFGIVNAVQWGAVAVVVFLLARLHLDAYVMSAITLIVGLHMFPLARLFRYKLHYATGAVLVAWGTASCLIFPRDTMQGATSLGTGAILWASAAVTLALAWALVRRAESL